jgi:hypothetical protein
MTPMQHPLMRPEPTACTEAFDVEAGTMTGTAADPKKALVPVTIGRLLMVGFLLIFFDARS